MRWLRENAGWISLLVGVMGGLAGMYVKATMADTETRVSVLEEKAAGSEKRLDRIEDKLDRILEAVRREP